MGSLGMLLVFMGIINLFSYFRVRAEADVRILATLAFDEMLIGTILLIIHFFK